MHQLPYSRHHQGYAVHLAALPGVCKYCRGTSHSDPANIKSPRPLCKHLLVQGGVMAAPGGQLEPLTLLCTFGMHAWHLQYCQLARQNCFKGTQSTLDKSTPCRVLLRDHGKFESTRMLPGQVDMH